MKNQITMHHSFDLKLISFCIFGLVVLANGAVSRFDLMSDLRQSPFCQCQRAACDLPPKIMFYAIKN